MSNTCQITGKRPCSGRSYTTRGIAKKRKGIGLHITSKTKRKFQPNIVKKRVWLTEENRFRTIRLSTSAMRTMNKNGVSKAVKK